MVEDLRYSLAENPLVELVVSEIGRTPPDWDRILAEFCDEVIVSQNNRFDNSNLPGILAELHVKMVLEGIAAVFEELVLRPIPFRQRVGNFRFDEGRLGNYRVYDSSARRDYVEYDGLVLTDRLPTILEVKMTSARAGNSLIRESTSARRINRLLLPLGVYFKNTDFAYILVLPKDTGELFIRGGASLLERGGIIAPFYATLEEFRAEVAQIAPRLSVGSFFGEFLAPEGYSLKDS